MRWVCSVLVAVTVVLGGGATALAAQDDHIPAEITVGQTAPIVKHGVVADENCQLFLAGRPAGTCEPGGPPLRGTLVVGLDHPLGRQILSCQGCSEGRTPRVVMPNLLGLTVKEAEEQLATTGWRGGISTTATPVDEPGQVDLVVGSDPPPGADLGEADSVVLHVGKLAVHTPELPPSSFARQRHYHQPEVVLGEVTVLPLAGTTGPVVAPTAGPPIPPPTVSAISDGPVAVEPAGGSANWWVAPAVIGALVVASLAWLLLRRLFSSRPQPPPGERPIHVILADDGPLPSRRSLRPDTPYTLSVDIGELRGAGDGFVPLTVVVFDSRTPTLTGDQVQTLPLSGGPAGRYDFPLRTPPGSGTLRWRCGLYCRGVLVQSFVVRAAVGQPGGWSAERDYVTSFGLDPAMLSAFERHELSVMVNRDAPAEHGVYTYFDGRRVAMTGHVPAGHLDTLREHARQLYDEAGTDTMDDHAMARTLGSFALHGLSVLSVIEDHVDDELRRRGGDPAALRRTLSGQARVQVAWCRGSACPLPATMVYDYDLEDVDDPGDLALCHQFLADLDAGRPPVCLGGTCACASPRTVCPAGFWGFRLLLSCQPSHQTPVPDANPRPTAPPEVVVGVSTDPAFERRDDHLADLRAALREVTWHEERAKEALLTRLRTTQPSLIYLYCHGGVNLEEGYVVLGRGDRLTARDRSWRGLTGAWRSRPLVLLNGCSTAALGDDVPNPLTAKLLGAGAAGVVGTEVDITEDLAVEFARTTVRLLLRRGWAAAAAVREGRLAVLRMRSPLGLTYMAFAPTDLRVIRG